MFKFAINNSESFPSQYPGGIENWQATQISDDNTFAFGKYLGDLDNLPDGVEQYTPPPPMPAQEITELIISRGRFFDLLGFGNQVEFNAALENSTGIEKSQIQTIKDNLFARSEIDLKSVTAQQMLGLLTQIPADNPILTAAEMQRILSNTLPD